MSTNHDTLAVEACPWCGNTSFSSWGKEVRGFRSVSCRHCALVYVQNRLTEQALAERMQSYLSDTHQADDLLNQRRQEMYTVEIDFLCQFLKPNARVLDVGCSGGYMLDEFVRRGHEGFGIELGEEAARKAAEKHRVWCGVLPDLEIDETFDCVVFRGVLQYFPDPKAYLQKSLDVLAPGGLIFVTSTPNAASFCFKLFEEQFNQHVPEDHLMHFCPGHFDAFFRGEGLKRLAEATFYEETPYADPTNDILKVSEAIALREAGIPIPFKSPSFWGNMMTLVYARPD